MDKLPAIYSWADVEREISDQKADDGRDLERLIVSPRQFADLMAALRREFPDTPLPHTAWRIHYPSEQGFTCMIVKGPAVLVYDDR